ncbi:MAG: hypothetical protein KAY32_07385 [Candidatus Eisenbacteria sp.]|nr:hypothetical protein [Candidatus Eisenbacteria bacterium]
MKFKLTSVNISGDMAVWSGSTIDPGLPLLIPGDYVVWDVDGNMLEWGNEEVGYETLECEGCLEPGLASLFTNGDHEVSNDMRAPCIQGRADTVWFGGYNEVEGIAYNSVDDGYGSAVWTWDAGTIDPLEGWTCRDLSGVFGAYMNICTEMEWTDWLCHSPHVPDPGGLSGNALYCATDVPFSPLPGHLPGHHEYMISPIVDREYFTSEGGWLEVIVRWDAFNYLRWSAATFYRPGFLFYPYTTPEDPTPRWSGRSGQSVWHYTGQTSICVQDQIFSLTAPVDGTPLPYNWEQMKFIYEVMTDCNTFGIPPAECLNEGNTNGAPIYDNVRVGITGGVDAPPIAVESGHLFHDGFGQLSPLYLDPGDVCNSDVAYDRSGNNIDYNDWLADTAAVHGPPVTLPEYQYWIDLCVNVAQKGPRQEMIPDYHAWKARFTSDPEADFVCALMDTAMVLQGGQYVPVDDGQVRVTYFHEDDPGFDPNFDDRTPEQEILPDLVFTPGTRIEYYWRSYWAGSPPQEYFTLPRTGVYEMEFLPMMELNTETQDEYDVIWPSVLYVDAFNGGEEKFLVPTFDQLGIAFDKFDRQDFSSNYDASMQRSFGLGFYNPGGWGNNGCTLEQLMGYRMILFTSGVYGIGGGEVGDFSLLANWLGATDCGAEYYRRGLVFNGNEIGEIMGDPDEGKALPFFVDALGGAVLSHAYRDYNSDDYPCVWLEPGASPEFEPAVDIAAFKNGAPEFHAYNVLGALSPTVGNLMFVPSVNAVYYNYPEVTWAQIVREVNTGGGGGYKTVVDGFSFHELTERYYGGQECPDDSLGIVAGCADLLGPELDWLTDGGAAAFDMWRYPCENTSVGEGSETHVSGPVNFLYASRPNPFRGSATIRFNMAAESPVKIAIYDVSGRLVRTLSDGKAQAGENTLTWDGTDDAGNRVNGGIFWMEMITSSYKSAKRLVVLR